VRSRRGLLRLVVRDGTPYPDRLAQPFSEQPTDVRRRVAVRVAADGVHGARVPHLRDVVGRENVGEQLDMVPVGVAQDHVVNLPQVGLHRLEVGDEAVVRTDREVVVRARVVDEGEVGSVDEHGQPRPYVSHVDRERRPLHVRGHDVLGLRVRGRWPGRRTRRGSRRGLRR